MPKKSIVAVLARNKHAIAFLALVFLAMIVCWWMHSRITLEQDLRNDEQFFGWLLQSALKERATIPADDYYTEWREYNIQQHKEVLHFLKDRTSLERPYLHQAILSGSLSDDGVPYFWFLLNFLEEGYDTIGIKLKYPMNKEFITVALPVYEEFDFWDKQTRESYEGTTTRPMSVYLDFGNELRVKSNSGERAVIEMPRELLSQDISLAVYDIHGNESDYLKPFVRKKARPFLDARTWGK